MSTTARQQRDAILRLWAGINAQTPEPGMDGRPMRGSLPPLPQALAEMVARLEREMAEGERENLRSEGPVERRGGAASKQEASVATISASGSEAAVLEAPRRFSDSEPPERELELIRLAVSDAACTLQEDGWILALTDERAIWLWPGSSFRRRLVELGRLVEQHTQDAEARRALGEA